MRRHYNKNHAILIHAQLTVYWDLGQNSHLAVNPVVVDSNTEPDLLIFQLFMEAKVAKQLEKKLFATHNHALLTAKLVLGLIGALALLHVEEDKLQEHVQ